MTDIPKLILRVASKATDAIRAERHQDKDFTVIPLVALVEGVIQAANSPQPELVRADELEPAVWNGRPVTFDHPDINGVLVSASVSPEMLEEVQVGTIFNTEIVDGTKLRLEAWVENDKVEARGEEAVATFNKILEGETAEVSTGYFADSIPQKGKFNGESFEAVQSNIKPDHIAILTGTQVGACSIEDGCGAPRLNKGGEDEKQKGELTIFPGSLIQNTKHGKDFEISDMDIRRAISSALETKGEFFWGISAVFGKSFVFETDFGVLEQRDFSINEEGVVTIAEEGISVRPQTEFVPVVANEGDDTLPSIKSSVENKEMEVKEKIDGLIAHEGTAYKEEDRNFLEGIDPERLDLLHPLPVQNQGEDGEENEGKEGEGDGEGGDEDEGKEGEQAPISAEAYLETAPPELQELLGEGLRMQKAHRKDLISAIRTNKSSGFSEEELGGFKTEILEKLMAAVAPADYSLRGAPVSNVSNASREDENAIPRAPEVFPRKTA